MITSVVASVISLLILLKLAEWVFQTWQQCRVENPDVFPSDRHRWPIFITLSDYFGSPGELIARHIIRPGRLAIVLTGMLILTTATDSPLWKFQKWAAGLAAACLIIHVWVAISCCVKIILHKGFVQIHLRDRYFRLMDKRFPPEEMEKFSNRPSRIGSFFGFLRDMMTIVVIGHTGVFTALQQSAPNAGKLTNLTDGFIGIQTIYFSVVTAATVGYGDLAPEKGAWLAQAAVASEICASFTLVTLALSCMSLSIDKEPR